MENSSSKDVIQPHTYNGPSSIYTKICTEFLNNIDEGISMSATEIAKPKTRFIVGSGCTESIMSLEKETDEENVFSTVSDSEFNGEDDSQFLTNSQPKIEKSTSIVIPPTSSECDDVDGGFDIFDLPNDDMLKIITLSVVIFMLILVALTVPFFFNATVNL